MRQFVITTTSESGDNYVYFVEHHVKPSSTILNKWLIENGSDVEDGYCYESIDDIIEIKDFKRLNN